MTHLDLFAGIGGFSLAVDLTFQLWPLMRDISECENGLLPTTVYSQCYKKIRPMAPTEKRNEHGDALQARIGEMFPELIGTYFHPEFLEQMMGFPIGHTDVKPSETQSSPK